MFEPYVVPNFGGGLAFDANPVSIRDDQWTWSDGWIATNGAAEVAKKFSQINSGAWLPASHSVIGMVPDLVGSNLQMLLVCSHTSTQVVRLFTLTTAGTATEVAVSGTAPTATGAIATAAFMNGSQIIAPGTSSATNYSLIRYDGTNFFRIAPSAALQGFFITQAAGHLILAYLNGADGQHELRWSDANDYSTWDAATSNAADEVTISGWGSIGGIAPFSNGAVVLAAERSYAVTSTGGIPAFTVSNLEERGSTQSLGSLIVSTPYGIIYDGGNDFYVVGGPGLGQAIYRYWLGQLGSFSVLGKLLWHPPHGALIASNGSESLFYNAAQRAWWRRSLPSSPHSWQEVAAGRQWVMKTTGAVHVEQTTLSAGNAFSAAVVDTKDFAFENPTAQDYLDRIKVEWEPLTNATTDAIEVQAAVRNDLSSGTLGTPGFATSNVSFTSLGTLTGGASELPIRAQGKYARFRFVQSSGITRVRGFTIRRQRGGDRPT